jgi:hypothetical protein
LGILEYNEEVMKKFISQILMFSILAISLSAQSENSEPVLVDEFGKLPLGDLSLRMDVLQNELKTKKDSSALIRIYGGTEDWLVFPHIRKAFYKAYFSNFEAIDKSKIVIQLCDSSEKEIRNQFFIVSQGAKFDKCEETSKKPLKTSLIKVETFHPVGSADDYLGTKGVDEATTEASYNFTAELLTKSPESKVYIIGYAGRFFEPAEGKSEKEIVSEIDSLKVNKPVA